MVPGNYGVVIIILVCLMRLALPDHQEWAGPHDEPKAMPNFRNRKRWAGHEVDPK
jgi:hypothetical protein